jgi:outer membrane receptor for ferrienterochelin and colicins
MYLCAVKVVKSIFLLFGILLLFVGNIGVDVFRHICEKEGTSVSYFIPAEDHCAEIESKIPSCCQESDFGFQSNNCNKQKKKDCCDEEVEFYQLKLDFYQNSQIIIPPYLFAHFDLSSFTETETKIFKALGPNYCKPPPYLITAFSLLFFSTINAQVKGIVYGSNNAKKEPLYGAKIKLLQAKTGVVTGEDGLFELVLPKILPDTMVVSAMGYNSDTIVVSKSDRFISFEIVLYSDQLLPEVLVEVKRGTHTVSRLKTLHVEEIGSGELRKAACCNLSESFETNVSVDVNITDAVSGAKKIQMMGLDGVYTQIQMENIPYLRGLESSFGLNSISGTWINSIQITKGTGNVVNGYESMAGLVNLELKKPHDMEKVYVNLYVSGMGRNELNYNSGFRLGERWSSGWLIHASSHPIDIDYNKDGFRDMPNGSNVAAMNRYHFEGKKMEAQIGVNTYWDNKNGGQVGYNRQNENGLYGVTLDSRHIDLFAKTGFFMKKPYNSIGVVYNFKYQTVDAQFGNRIFAGEEKRGYVNAIFDGIIGNTDHKIKFGTSGVYAEISQHMDSLISDRIEIVPGVFGEYTYTGSRLSMVAGIREDYHNLFGFQTSPRMHLKYILTERTDLRVTGGKGWRVPNYQIDNISLLATSRAWIEPDTIMPEISWNVGGSFVQELKLFNQKGSFTLDYYHTRFENQMLVDRDENVNAIIFSNLNGTSFSNSLQAELAVSPGKYFDLRFAYKFLDVRAEYGGVLQQNVMIPRHRGFFNMAYKTKNKRWEYDLTVTVFGEARLPETILPDLSVTTENKSDAFPITNAQITHVYKKWDFYLGGENIFRYTQKNPIIDAENPFSDTFDATRLWAPVFGINIYAGLRYSLKQEERN